MKKFLATLIITGLWSMPALADWKLSQKIAMPGGASMISTIYVKGVRKRTETKMELDPQTAKMMEQMKSMGMDPAANMPVMPTFISMCDQKQDVFLNDINKLFFVDYYDWSSVPPEKLAKRSGPTKITIKGTMTLDSWIEDSGKRQTMFGLPAKWLKFTTMIEMSPDACDPSPPTKMEMEGWFVNLMLQTDNCSIAPQRTGGTLCMPKMIVKRTASPGFLLTGTTRTYVNGKLISENKTETVDLSKATLLDALFDIPKDYTEVDSIQELQKAPIKIDTSAKTVFRDGSKAQKTIAIDFFSGSANKIDQDSVRSYVSGKVSSAGMNGYIVSSSSDIAGAKFANVIGVEIKKIKESGAAKLGGLFGKVTGSNDISKAGTSSAEIIVTLYGSDGKTVVASSPATAEIKGSATDAVKAAIDQVIGNLLAKAK